VTPQPVAGRPGRVKQLLRPAILVALVAATFAWEQILAERWDELSRPARLAGMLALYYLVMGVIYRAAVLRGWKVY